MLTTMKRPRTHGALEKASEDSSPVGRDLVDEVFDLRQQVAAEGLARFERWRPELKRLAFRAGALSTFVIRSKHTPPADFDGNNERSDTVQAAS